MARDSTQPTPVLESHQLQYPNLGWYRTSAIPVGDGTIGAEGQSLQNWLGPHPGNRLPKTTRGAYSTSHISQLDIIANPLTLNSIFRALVSPAPILESFSVIVDYVTPGLVGRYAITHVLSFRWRRA